MPPFVRVPEGNLKIFLLESRAKLKPDTPHNSGRDIGRLRFHHKKVLSQRKMWLYVKKELAQGDEIGHMEDASGIEMMQIQAMKIQEPAKKRVGGYRKSMVEKRAEDCHLAGVG